MFCLPQSSEHGEMPLAAFHGVVSIISVQMSPITSVFPWFTPNRSLDHPENIFARFFRLVTAFFDASMGYGDELHF